MKQFILAACLSCIATGILAGENKPVNSIYEIPLKDIQGKATTLAPYKGQVMLLINVASKCGFTKQYTGLEALHAKFKDKGLRVLGFPCNDFGGQEPGTNEE